MEYPAYFLVVAVTLLTSANLGHAISVSVTRYVSSMNEETDSEVIVGFYSYSTASDESSVSCSMTSSDSSLFVLQGGNIVKRSCTSCMNYDSYSSYTITVTCTTVRTMPWYGSATTSDSKSMIFSIVKSSPPYFTSPPYIVRVDGLSVRAGQAIYDLNWADPDNSSLTVTYTPAARSHVFGNTLWNFNNGIGIITAAKTMREEFTDTYYLTVTVADRRNSVSQTITIYLNACHITPNCTDQSRSIPDTFQIGGTLFTQNVPNSGLFTDLSYNMSTTLPQASINSSSGAITTTGNITVHPYYPSRTWKIHVTVSASGSCYMYTCTHSLTVTFTNWPILITSLPASTTVHEDEDGRILIHSLITWDNNYDPQDNVTCYISSDPLTGLYVGTLFELVHDGYQSFNSYSLYKKNCNSPGCGAICNTIGCLDHAVTTSYVIGITCNDGYGSSNTNTFTMYVRQNDPPVLTNLNNTIVLDADVITIGDVLFSMYYTDTENETLNYNYTYNGAVSSNLFNGDTYGNYHNNAANITAIADQWDLSNATYTVYICGRDRRNTRCGTLTILILERKNQEVNKHEAVSVIIGSVLGTCIPTLILVVVVGVLFWRRRQLCRDGKSWSQSKTYRSATEEGKNTESHNIRNTFAITNAEYIASSHVELQDITGDMNENANIRSSVDVTYDALHPCANTQEHVYSSYCQESQHKGESCIYENTTIPELR